MTVPPILSTPGADVAAVFQFEQDVSLEYADLVRKASLVAWDIETSGLSWSSDKIGICQLHIRKQPVAIVKMSGAIPNNLVSLLEDPGIRKVFHHAMFDLRFMAYQWAVEPRNIGCTKIASKLLNKTSTEHSLKHLAQRYLNVNLNKRGRRSNWRKATLTERQVAYASEDVVHLLELIDVLEADLRAQELLSLARACFDHIPSRVQLDIRGYTDIYSY